MLNAENIRFNVDLLGIRLRQCEKEFLSIESVDSRRLQINHNPAKKN